MVADRAVAGDDRARESDQRSGDAKLANGVRHAGLLPRSGDSRRYPRVVQKPRHNLAPLTVGAASVKTLTHRARVAHAPTRVTASVLRNFTATVCLRPAQRGEG